MGGLGLAATAAGAGVAWWRLRPVEPQTEAASAFWAGSSVTPQAFGEMIAPLFGADAAAGVVAAYEAQANAAANAITAGTSAQVQLALTPRTVDQWLAEISA